MGGTTGSKRKAQEAKLHSRPNKKFKKQTRYSSGSESESESEVENIPAPILQEKDTNIRTKVSKGRDQRSIPPAVEDSEIGAEDDNENAQGSEKSGGDDSLSEAENDLSNVDTEADPEDDSQPAGETEDSDEPRTQQRLTKRHDPEAFASSINAILSSKLTTGNRKDPVLARSKTAATASHELAEAKLEAKAKRKLRDEKRALNDKGRVRNVLLGDRRRTPGLSESEAEDGVLSEATESAKPRITSAAGIAEQERRLKKTAQRGVVKLFNAVRAAQVKADEVSKDVKTKSIVGVQRREEKVGEMGRQAFLDLVGKGNIGTV